MKSPEGFSPGYQENFIETAPQPQQPTLEMLDSFKGREIEGIRPVVERFSTLRAGHDFSMVAKNPLVHCDDTVEEHFLFINPQGGDKQLTVEAPHWRTITEEGHRAVANLSSGKQEPFYAVNTKGVGYLKPSAKGYNFDGYKKWYIDDPVGEHDFGYKILGLSAEDDYDHGKIMEKANFLLNSGLRTECYWGVAEMKKICYQGELTDVSKLKTLGVIPNLEEYNPSQAVRLLKINHRIEQVYLAPERAPELFADAFKVFNKEALDKGLQLPELHLENPEHQRMFFQTFFERMGQNIAVLLNIGYSHYRLHASNVTLAAEIPDIGTMGPWDAEPDEIFTKKYHGVPRTCIKDMRDICYGLRNLVTAGKNIGLDAGDAEQLEESFFKGFNGSANQKQMREKNITAVSAQKWMKKIFEHLIIQKRNLTGLQHGQIEDWNIQW